LRSTRRYFLSGVFTLALAVVSGLAMTKSSVAETFSSSELSQAGPLGDQTIGLENAPVTVIEYASLTCYHCAHFAAATFPFFKQ
jgi:hypothetical protein